MGLVKNEAGYKNLIKLNSIAHIDGFYSKPRVDEELLGKLVGPDFPTGGIIVNKDDLPEIYRTGTGKLRVRGRVSIEKVKGITSVWPSASTT